VWIVDSFDQVPGVRCVLTKLPTNYPRTLPGVESLWDGRLSASSELAQVMLRWIVALNAVVCETGPVDSHALGDVDRKVGDSIFPVE
jgi:hypothetical protein